MQGATTCRDIRNGGFEDGDSLFVFFDVFEYIDLTLCDDHSIDENCTYHNNSGHVAAKSRSRPLLIRSLDKNISKIRESLYTVHSGSVNERCAD